MSKKQPFQAALTLAIVLVFFPFVSSAQNKDTAKNSDLVTLNFAVVPQQTASQLFRSWAPVLIELQKLTGHQYVFRTAPSIPEFEDRIQNNEYDIAYMNPYHFAVFNKSGFRAVARAKDRKIKGIIVIHKNSDITTLQELSGKELAFPAPAAFAASVLPRANLTAKNIPHIPKYVSSHDSVYRAVAEGFFVAGGGIGRTLSATDAKTRENLKVLWTTPGYTPHAIAASSTVPNSVLVDVQKALVAMGDSESGKKALNALKITGWEVAQDTDWDDVRALPIELPLGKQ